MTTSTTSQTNQSQAESLEAVLWASADKLRSNMDAAEYKHVVLGIIFLKYISDAFEERHKALEKEATTDKGIDPEDKDEYLANRIFWVPKTARWEHIQSNAKQADVGKLIDAAMTDIEKENSTLKNVLPKEYARPTLDKRILGGLIDLISGISLGSTQGKSSDLLGKVYEYFLGRFAAAEGKRGGEFFTPPSVVHLLVEMLAPDKGRIYDPACGSAGMFVSSERFIENHGGNKDDISVFGQESNPTTWRLARMNLAIRGISANLGPHHGDTFHQDLHPDLKADFILANPPFNISDWGGELLREDKRWKHGTPPVSNANYAWIQHFIDHLSPRGYAGFVMANGSMSSNQSGEGDIRKNIIEADLVDCMVALPGQLFFTTQIPVCLWFLARNKNDGKRRDRRGQTLFIDARGLGEMKSRVERILTSSDIARIASTYHAWRGDKDAGQYEDTLGYCKSATADEIRSHGYVLTPGRYVGAAEVASDDEPFVEKLARLKAELEGQFEQSAKLEAAIKENFSRLGL